MADMSEAVEEILDEAGDSKLTTIVAILVTITATFLGLAGVKAGNIGQAMDAARAEYVNSWSYFQSKSTKQHVSECLVEQLTAVRVSLPPAQRDETDKLIATTAADVNRYEQEKKEIEAKARAAEAELEVLGKRDDQFDVAEGLLSIALALFGVTVLSKKRWMLVIACVPTAAGLAVGLAGFCGWSLQIGWVLGLLG